MGRTQVTAVLLAIAVTRGTAALSQTTREGELVSQKADKSAHLQAPARETGDRIITALERLLVPPPPDVRLTFGGFRPGAGFALGAAYDVPVGTRAMWSGSGAISVRHFKQAGTSIDLTALASDRFHVRASARWEDAPDLRFFGLGPGTPRSAELGYALTTTEAGAEVRAQGPKWLAFGGGMTFLNARSADGAGASPLPGVSASPEWWYATAYGEIDTRHSPGYTTGGALYRVALHDYNGLSGAADFTRTEIDLRQFVPLVHDNWVVALQARADLSAAADGQVIPFFLLPSLGGRDTLRGFDDYRFADRNRLLFRSELRWTAAPVVDMAVFLDQGTVAPRAGALDLHDLKRSWGIGAQIHGPTFTALRLEVAHSAEGWRYNIAQHVSF